MSAQRGQNSMPDDSEIVEGEPLAAEDTFWLDMAQGMAKESITSIEEAAKQVIAIASLSQAVYFAAMSFAQVRQAVLRFPQPAHVAIAIALVSPLVCWVLALFFAIRVFKPETYQTNLSSPDLARRMYQDVVSYKHNQLQAAYWFLVLGFLPLVINVLLTFLILPA